MFAATAVLKSAYGPSSCGTEPTAVSPKLVLIRPGSMIDTWTPKPRTSKRMASEIASTANLVP